LRTILGTGIKKPSSSAKSLLADSIAHARFKTFLKKYPLIHRELFQGVRVTTRFAPYQEWRHALLADFIETLELETKMLKLLV
jgi:hypothetical protein